MDLRYVVEFKELPRILFNDTRFCLLEFLPRGKYSIYSVYEFLSKKMGLENPYKIDDFDVELIEKSDVQFSFKITMPTEGIKTTFCKYVYICINFLNDEVKVKYFTVEYTHDDLFGYEFSGKSLILGEVKPNGNHINYGSIEEENILKKVENISFNN